MVRRASITATVRETVRDRERVNDGRTGQETA